MDDSLEKFGGGEVEGLKKENPFRVYPHERLRLRWHLLNAVIAIVSVWAIYFLFGLLMALVGLVFPDAFAVMAFTFVVPGLGALVIVLTIFKASVRSESKALENYKKKFGTLER